ncbi:MAG: hypothetical protein [Olavius algarvensis spirochete endosymbiont]|nr:MAG: hypothetical protein [Olavius algarvensis spirochete endosymbiont]
MRDVGITRSQSGSLRRIGKGAKQQKAVAPEASKLRSSVTRRPFPPAGVSRQTSPEISFE